MARPPYKYSAEIERLWPLFKEQGRTRKELWAEMNRREPVHERTVRKKVAEIEKRRASVGEQFPRKHLTDLVKRRATVDWGYLAILDLIARHDRGEGLWEHEASWAMRLKDALDDLDPVSQWVLIEEYGRRERAQSEYGLPTLYTVDLDAVLALRPWTKEGMAAYSEGLLIGEIPALLWKLPESAVRQAAQQGFEDFRRVAWRVSIEFVAQLGLRSPTEPPDVATDDKIGSHNPDRSVFNRPSDWRKQVRAWWKASAKSKLEAALAQPERGDQAGGN